MEVLEIVERVGAYAGFAAVVGLAVLSALYFSQARDVRRLREWAGRAPERVVPGPAVPAPPKTTAPAATGASPARSAAGAAATAPRSAAASSGPSQERAAAVAGAPTSGGANPAAAERPGPGAVPGVPASESTASPPGSGNGKAGAPGGSPPPVRQIGPVVSSRTQSIPRPEAPDEGGRSLAPRYVALIVAGVLILGAGIAYAVVRGSQPEAPPPVARQGPAPFAPSDVTVSVLNGTTAPGLAARIGDRVESAGFRLGNVTNASEQQRAESVILYMPGADREARIVGRRLRIEQTERADAGDRVLAGTARVVVMVGADQIR